MGDVEVLLPRTVPLGGPRAMTVRRTLPQRARTFVGAWCFLDHYGPDEIAGTGGMRVPPHPHTGLQTVSWLFAGEIEHRDSAGFHALVRPGEVNLMTAGRGISHSEVSTASTAVLHGVQLWAALPDTARFTEPGFEHHAPGLVTGDGFAARVFLGRAFGDSSPVRTHTALLGAEVTLEPGRRISVATDPAFEHGVLADTGQVLLDGTRVGPGQLGCVPPGRTSLELAAGEGAARLLLLGGPPFGEQILMWWNFVGRDHAEITRFRAAWQQAIGAPDAPTDGDSDRGSGSGSGSTAPGGFTGFTLPHGSQLPPLPAPALPGVRLRPRG